MSITAKKMRPPHGQGTTDSQFPGKTVATATDTSTAAQDTGVTVGPDQVTFSTSHACYIRFGSASTIAAATASDFYLPAGAIVPLTVMAEDRYFRVYGTATGVVTWYRSW